MLHLAAQIMSLVLAENWASLAEEVERPQSKREPVTLKQWFQSAVPIVVTSVAPGVLFQLQILKPHHGKSGAGPHQLWGWAWQTDFNLPGDPGVSQV